MPLNFLLGGVTFELDVWLVLQIICVCTGCDVQKRPCIRIIYCLVAGIAKKCAHSVTLHTAHEVTHHLRVRCRNAPRL